MVLGHSFVATRFLAAGRAITHWYQLDADDLVHEHGVATVSQMVPFDFAAMRGVTIRDYRGPGVARVLGHGDNASCSIGRRVRVWDERRALAPSS